MKKMHGMMLAALIAAGFAAPAAMAQDHDHHDDQVATQMQRGHGPKHMPPGQMRHEDDVPPRWADQPRREWQGRPASARVPRSPVRDRRLARLSPGRRAAINGSASAGITCWCRSVPASCCGSATDLTDGPARIARCRDARRATGSTRHFAAAWRNQRRSIFDITQHTPSAHTVPSVTRRAASAECPQRAVARKQQHDRRGHAAEPRRCRTFRHQQQTITTATVIAYATRRSPPSAAPAKPSTPPTIAPTNWSRDSDIVSSSCAASRRSR